LAAFGSISAAAGAGAPWSSANLAIYIPFSLPVDASVNGVKFNCTAGASAGRNFDLGFFDAATGATLSTAGATLMAAGVNTWGASQPIIGGNTYYLGMSANSTSLGVWRWASTVNALRMVGVAQEASAEPLPTITATPAQMAQTNLPVIVLTFSSVAQ
jgi:hypothetical protein